MIIQKIFSSIYINSQYFPLINNRKFYPHKNLFFMHKKTPSIETSLLTNKRNLSSIKVNTGFKSTVTLKTNINTPQVSSSHLSCVKSSQLLSMRKSFKDFFNHLIDDVKEKSSDIHDALDYIGENNQLKENNRKQLTKYNNG